MSDRTIRRRLSSGSGFTRRGFLAFGGLGLLFPGVPRGAVQGTSRDHPLRSFDEVMAEFMGARKVPGGALAVVKNRRLVYAKGYGWADRDRKVAAGADTLFRIASVSKPITAVGVMKLVQEKRVSLEAKAFDAAGLHPEPESRGPEGFQDPRIGQITLRQLLQHTGGWDRDRSGDPMFRWKQDTKPTEADCPLNADRIIRRMLGQKLDSIPGSRYAYSNFGYCILGRVIEKVTGEPYARYIKERILAPAGIKRMRIGASAHSGEGESHYYTADDRRVTSIFPGIPGKVPEPYGAFCLEAMEAHGGWVASAVDLARFAAALDDPLSSPLLKPETFQLMYAPPPAPVWRTKDGSLEAAFYACGWMVRPVGSEGRANYWHTGSLPGTNSLLVRRWDGLSWAVVFNQRSQEKSIPDGAIDVSLHRAAAAVKQWPEVDWFPRYE